MAIVGIHTLLFGVESVEESTRFFLDFGLDIHRSSVDETWFRLPEGSNVVLRPIDHPSIPRHGRYSGYGVKEVIWGVDSQESLDALQSSLSTDRAVVQGEDGAIRFLTDCGLPIGLKLFNRAKVVNAPDPLNAAGHVGRLSQQRKWKARAKPKTITHVVFTADDYKASFEFFQKRLGFSLSDHQLSFGVYARADGTNEHHNLLFLNMRAPGAVGHPAFHHVNFGVEDIDELMVGANYMTRRGWKYGFLGTGRHRIASALFCYLQSPAGGEVEYGADSDYLDDTWIPREWNPVFGTASWMSNPPPFMQQEPNWEFRLLPNGMDGGRP